jgi:hypothetical protein
LLRFVGAGLVATVLVGFALVLIASRALAGSGCYRIPHREYGSGSHPSPVPAPPRYTTPIYPQLVRVQIVYTAPTAPLAGGVAQPVGVNFREPGGAVIHFVPAVPKK